MPCMYSRSWEERVGYKERIWEEEQKMSAARKTLPKEIESGGKKSERQDKAGKNDP